MELFSIDMSSLPKEARKYPLLSEKFGIEPYQMVAPLVFRSIVSAK